MAVSTICSVQSCGKPHHKNGLCALHYGRKIRKRPMDGPPKLRHNRATIEAFFNGVRQSDTDDCLCWPFARSDSGYGIWEVNPYGESIASRAMCVAVHGPCPPEKPLALHSCGMGHLGCINPRHLRWGDAAMNTADAKRHGTVLKGSQVGSAKLTEEAVAQIRRELSFGIRARVLAAKYGVHEVQISKIKHGVSWRHVP